MKPGTVTVAFLHPGHYSACFAESLQDLLFHDMAAGQRIVSHPHGKMGKECGTGGIVAGRNKLARAFLDESSSEWLFMVDSDMGFAGDTVERLIACADPDTRPIVGGLCFAMKTDGRSSFYGIRYRATPTLYEFAETDTKVGFVPMFAYPRDELVKVAATGAACVLVHRRAMEAIRSKYGDVWFDPITHPKGPTTFSEDLSFCVRAAGCDMAMHVHTGVKTTHDKGGVFLDEGHFLAALLPPPPIDPVAVIVPVLDRPHNAEPFMRSLRATTGLATVYAIATEGDDDTIKAWDAQGATVLTVDDPGTFSRKANHGYRHTTEPWMFFTGDDVRFREGWYSRALRSAGDRFHLVAVNDLGNAAVIAGRHATHALMRRSWVDEHGASWDGPGTVAHEGYRHWYVDNEWSTVATQQGVLIGAPDAVVEHLHPIWGKAEMDSTYRKGQQSTDRDKRLWDRRIKEHV